MTNERNDGGDGGTSYQDIYQDFAQRFTEKHGMGDSPDELTGHWRVVCEEVRELAEVVEARSPTPLGKRVADAPYTDAEREQMAGEMADVLFSLHVLADMMDVDLRAAFADVAEYNMQKSTERDENGKITDDVGADVDVEGGDDDS